MNQLTEEQRKRIEENRQKALERRAAALRNANAKASSADVPKSNVVDAPPIFKADVPKKNVNISSTISEKISTVPQNSNSTEKSNLSSDNAVANNFYKNTNSSSIPSKSSEAPSYRDYVRGDCVMLNRQRFFVDVSYHKELIDVFKTIPSRMYDTQTKKWNFLLKDYGKLISSVKSLGPNVLLVPLPYQIRKIFSSATEKRFIKEHDLSSLDPVMLKSLLPFQVEGVNFGVQKKGRVLIADDMGLGKTIQAIAIADYFKDWPLLVVTPSSVRYSWQESFHRWLPSMDPQEITVINKGKDHLPNNKIILMSYELLSRKKSEVLNRKFNSIILDESHFLKNHKSMRTQAAMEVMKHIKRIILLSGTPALSRPMELYTQLSSLRPQNFFSFKEYGMRYCNGTEKPWGWDYSGSSRMEELQLLLEETVMIRRLKSDVIKQLPAKFRQMIVLDPSLIYTKDKTLQSLKKKLERINIGGMEKRGCLLEYFHYSGEIKLKAVCDYVSDLLECGRKFLCFAHHQNVLKGVSSVLESKNVDFIYIDGSVSSERRKHLCDRFQFNDSCKVAVLSITAANCGITLTAASLVLFAELFWNPGILTQAEDRAHRIGQENSVVVQYLVAKGTADDEIWPMVQKKLDVLNKAGLSKDNFKSADTIMREDIMQAHDEEFWNEWDESLDKLNCSEEYDNPEKRLKLEL